MSPWIIDGGEGGGGGEGKKNSPSHIIGNKIINFSINAALTNC